jgi:hypothetical protein
VSTRVKESTERCAHEHTRAARTQAHACAPAVGAGRCGKESCCGRSTHATGGSATAARRAFSASAHTWAGKGRASG